MGTGLPKALVLLAGQPLLTRALATVARCPDVSLVVIVAPPSRLDEAGAAVSGAQVPAGLEVLVVPGGTSRGDSVAAGLAALPRQASIVLVHDAARALAPVSLFASVIEAVRAGHSAVIPGLPVVDTIKEVDAAGHVVSTPDRSSLRAIQTPQGFDREVLRRAHESSAGALVTDDAALVERMGIGVHVIAGDPLALKITTREDLVLAETMLERRPA